jgi:hypothetical protein
MVIRKLTLEEWFLQYQLIKIKDKAVHLPFVLRANITKAAKGYEKVPYNAIVLKALGLLAIRKPIVNRMLFRTPFGVRFLESNSVRINFPITIEHNGKKITSAVVIQNTHLKSVEEINKEIKESCQKTLSHFPVTQFVHNNKNNILNRTLLKILYKGLMSLPSFYHNRGGGFISYSSITNHQTDNMLLTPISFGPTAFTFCMNSIEKVNGETFLHIGIGFDHTCFGGAFAIELLKEFCKELENLSDH